MNNRDDHTKNLAFMLEADGRWQLAPPFDGGQRKADSCRYAGQLQPDLLIFMLSSPYVECASSYDFYIYQTAGSSQHSHQPLRSKSYQLAQGQGAEPFVSALDLSGELEGCYSGGPVDLSSKPEHLNGFGSV